MFIEGFSKIVAPLTCLTQKRYLYYCKGLNLSPSFRIMPPNSDPSHTLNENKNIIENKFSILSFALDHRNTYYSRVWTTSHIS